MTSKRINVTKAVLPSLNEFNGYLEEIWQSAQLTNNGPLLADFEKKASSYLGVSNFQFVANGTLALQLALRGLDITEGEVITTPFTYVATTSAILWEHCQPVYVDIDPTTLCIDPEKIEAKITPKTKAILPVHVFGMPCNIDAIEKIAKKHNVKVIYDAAHAFGASYNGKSLLSFGDISICSFHATKPFHTIEGGCVIARDSDVSNKVDLLKRFGHNGDDHYILGINAKATEFQAAMGLCNLNHIDEVIAARRKVANYYDELLDDLVQRPKIDKSNYNFAYYPVVLHDEVQLKEIVRDLNQLNIFPRRYFYPSLNTLPYLKNRQQCPISEDISRRILCLPLYDSLRGSVIEEICEVVTKCVKQ